jgi:hypothetical protein
MSCVRKQGNGNDVGDGEELQRNLPVRKSENNDNNE